MSVLELPEVLDIPPKLIPILELLNKYRYFLIDGGRGSAKSHSIARLILYLCDHYNLRVFCGRETQNSIEESTYTLFVDLIRSNNLNYDLAATKIDHRVNQSPIRFKGFREQGSVNIKGLEGVDILWVDEAQAITKNTLDVIIPTIRKNTSKVFFTMNRHLKDDPVYLEFAGRSDCLHIHIDYFENPHCPESLIHEANVCKAKNMDDYRHIWLGEPLAQANNAVFRNVAAIVDQNLREVAPQSTFEYVLGVDLARSVDYTVLTVINKQLRRVEYWERMANENRTSWNYQKEKIHAVSKAYNNALTVIDSTGVGDPIVEDLQRMGVNVYYHQRDDSNKETPGIKFSAINKENLIEKLKVAIELKHITIPNIPILVDELTIFEAVSLPSGSYRYTAPEGKHDDSVISLALALWGTHSAMYERWKAASKQTATDEFWALVKQDLKNKDESSERQIEEGDDGISLSED